MNDNEFRQLLDHFNLSWDGYRRIRKGVKKRIRRHMQEVGCKTLQAYLSTLDSDGEARHCCERALTVSISRFFRDRGLWGVIERSVLPNMITEHRLGVSVWSAGCACGEEAYSIRMLWETMVKGEDIPEIEIWATDVNPDYLRRARVGIYPRSSLKEVPEPLMGLFFRPVEKNGYAIAKALKEEMVWRLHNLVSDPPLGPFHLVFLRNSLLTYYKEAIRKPAFQRVVDSMPEGGLLIVGAHESIPLGTKGLLSFGSHPCIFEKRR